MVSFSVHGRIELNLIDHLNPTKVSTLAASSGNTTLIKSFTELLIIFTVVLHVRMINIFGEVQVSRSIL